MRHILLLLALPLLTLSLQVKAEEFRVDAHGAHAFIQFRVKHLGYSWLYGRFNEFKGDFSYYENKPEKNRINIEIETASIDSNHGLRDKILRGKKFLNTDAYPTAKFSTTAYEKLKENTALLKGELTLHGQTHPIGIAVEHIGGGKDPWGGYRRGFEGRVTIEPEQWGIQMVKPLGAESAKVEMILTIEGIRRKKWNHKK